MNLAFNFYLCNKGIIEILNFLCLNAMHQESSHDYNHYPIAGEKLELIDDSIEHWWIACSLLSKREKGYIPSNYVKKTVSDTWLV